MVTLPRRAFLLAAAAAACAPGQRLAGRPDAAIAPPPRIGWVDVPGARLELLDWGGSGPPVLFLHGISSSAYLFGDLAPRLTPVAHIYGLTRRGHGHSTNSAGTYDLPMLIEDVVAALDRIRAETGAARAVLVGHSLAGHEMTALAELHPDRVAGLVYLEASFAPDALRQLAALPAPPSPVPSEADQASEAAMARWFSRTYAVGWGPAWRADLHVTSRFAPDGRYLGDVLSDAAQARLAALAAADRFDAGPRAALRDTPAVAFLAVAPHYPARLRPPDASPAVRQQADAYQAAQNAARNAWAARFRSPFPRGRVVVVPDADHYFCMQHEAVVAREVGAMVRRLQGR